jgi:Flp pilus assembly protein TadD
MLLIRRRFRGNHHFSLANSAPNPAPKIDTAILNQIRSAILIGPQDPRAHELLGKAYARLNRHELAQGELEMAIHLDPQNPHLPCMLGPVYRKRGMMDQAKLQLERCAALNGTHSTPENSRP